MLISGKLQMRRSKPLGRPTVAEIDLKSLAYNYREIQRRVPKGVSLLAVVKADAYGHGAVPISLKLQELGVEYLGVAITDEAVELRKGGVKSPILILGGIYPEELDHVFRYGLTPVIFDRRSLMLLTKAAQERKRKVKVHLKVDTGMTRLGVPVISWLSFLRELKRCPNIEVEGMLSHFSMNQEDESFTFEQWKEFQGAVEVAKGIGFSCKYFHMASSAALVGFPSFSANLVRPGIMLYGSYPSPEVRKLIRLKPVLTLKTRIHFLKPVPSGARISYGGTFVTKRESLIATLPIGYADGYSRFLSNCGEVLVRGRRAPVVGKVCMDFIMTDVTDVPGVSAGDEIVLIGRQGKEEITAEEVARKIESISYEVLCAIGKRVPRIYKG
jgi:alanine racemase